MKEDEVGLLVEIDPPNTTIGRDVVESIRRGDLDSMSFGFVVDEEEWSRDDVGEVRTLNSVSLFDVSVVTWPAYPDTEVAVRSLEHFRSIESEREQDKRRADDEQKAERDNHMTKPDSDYGRRMRLRIQEAE